MQTTITDLVGGAEAFNCSSADSQLTEHSFAHVECFRFHVVLFRA